MNLNEYQNLVRVNPYTAAREEDDFPLFEGDDFPLFEEEWEEIWDELTIP